MTPNKRKSDFGVQSGEQVFRTDELQDIDELYVVEVRRPTVEPAFVFATVCYVLQLSKALPLEDRTIGHLVLTHHHVAGIAYKGFAGNRAYEVFCD